MGQPSDDRQTSTGRDLRTLIATAWALDRARVLAQMLLLVLAGLIGGAGLVMLIPIVNSVAGTPQDVSLPVVGQVDVGSAPLWVLLAAFVTLIGIQALVQRTSTVNSARLQQRVVDTLRHEAFQAILVARWAWVLDLRRSDVVQIVTMGSARAGLAVQQVVTGTVSAVLAAATAAVALFVAPLVGFLAITAVVLVALAQATGIRPAHRLGRDFSERNRDLQAVVTDSLDSLRLVRAHDASARWVERLAAAFTSTRDVQIANTQRMATIGALSTVGTAAAASMLVLASTWAEVEPAAIVVMIVLISRLNSQVGSVVRTATLLANSLPAVGDVVTLTAQARDAAETGPITEGAGIRRDRDLDPDQVDPDQPLVELRRVTFVHPSSGGGVHDLDLELVRGRITAITGPSGAGKSTTADLVLGLLTPDSGSVMIDGAPLRADELPWWRRHIAYVPQETLLVPGTLRDNLVWSMQGEVEDEHCHRALRQAAATFVHRLPDSLDTIVGDRGIRLSGGERQRIAIARALLRRPTLLVLDEATSSLDDDTETEVLDTISSLTPAVTVLLIAHRRTTLAVAHHVIHIADGRRVQPPDRRSGPDR